jgi:hypothetical protein
MPAPSSGIYGLVGGRGERTYRTASWASTTEGLSNCDRWTVVCMSLCDE